MHGITMAANGRADEHGTILFFERVPAAARDRTHFFGELLERIERALDEEHRTRRLERR